MKNLFLISCLLFSGIGFSQSSDTRTIEDGLNKLINHPDFVQDVVNLSSEKITAESLDGYFKKYIPEYANFTTGSTKEINFEEIYFANTEGVSAANLSNVLNDVLKLNPAQSNHLNNVLTGNTTYGATNSYSSGIHTQMYDRGKNPNVDYAVDYAVDFFQYELGDGGMNSALIDIGGGILGMVGNYFHQQYQEKLAEQMILTKAMNDHSVYTSSALTDYVTVEKDQEDLRIHSKADFISTKSAMNISSGIDYKKAISLYSDAISSYSQNPERAYYLYKAYVSRGKCKMEIGAYRAATIDYYYAQRILDGLLSGQLPDKSIKSVYPPGYFDAKNKSTYVKGKVDFSIGTITNKDQIVLLTCRAYAKYRLNDFSGAINDCEEAKKLITQKKISIGTQPNNLNSVLQTVIGMCQYGMKQYSQSYTTFSKSSYTESFISDADGDGMIDFLDFDKAGVAGVVDSYEDPSLANYYGLPEFFPFDIAQIRGLSFYKAKKIDDAIKIYEAIVRSEEGNGVVRWNLFSKVKGDISAVYSTLGNFYYYKGNLKKSLENFDKAIQINPEYIEYYYCRANSRYKSGDKKGGDEDIAIVENPKLLDAITKSENYYWTKYQELNSQNSHVEALQLLREACQKYPDQFTNALIHIIQVVNDVNQTEKLFDLFEGDSLRPLLINYIYYQQNGQVDKEMETIEKAFSKGLKFSDATLVFQLHIKDKPYYGNLLAQYISLTNNNFAPADLDYDHQKKVLDSIYIGQDYSALPAVAKKSMENSKKQVYAKSLGEVENYLNLLDEDKMLLSMSPIHALDKIECLYILNRDAEAIKFAKAIIKKGKLMDIKMPEGTRDHGAEAKLAIKYISELK